MEESGRETNKNGVLFECSIRIKSDEMIRKKKYRNVGKVT